MWKTCLLWTLERIEEISEDGGDCAFNGLNPEGGLKAFAGREAALGDLRFESQLSTTTISKASYSFVNCWLRVGSEPSTPLEVSSLLSADVLEPDSELDELSDSTFSFELSVTVGFACASDSGEDDLLVEGSSLSDVDSFGSGAIQVETGSRSYGKVQLLQLLQTRRRVLRRYRTRTGISVEMERRSCSNFFFAPRCTDHRR